MRSFGTKDKIGYLFGDSAGSFVNVYVDVYFLIFCTSVLGINPIHMGTLFILARFWDAVNDPLVGWLTDRFKIGKSGDRFKPYIKLGMVPLAVAGVLAFIDVSSLDYVYKMVYVTVIYVLVGSFYTVTSVPFGSMATVITDKPLERAELSKMRAIGGSVVGIGGLSLVPLFAFNKEGDIVPEGFLGVAICFGILSILLYTLCTKFTEERISYETNKSDLNFFKVVKDALQNRPFIGVMVATIGSLLYISGYLQLGAYMFKDYYGVPQLLSLLSLLTLPLLVLAFFTVTPLIKKFGKKKVVVVSLIFNTIGAFILFLIPISSPIVFLILSAIFNYGQTVFMMLIWALVSDCIDYQEYRTGKRVDGSLYSIYTFSRRIGSTIAGSLSAYALGWIGYVSSASVQSEAVISNIRLLYTGLPLAVCILELIGIGLIFNLNNDKLREVAEALKNRATNKAHTSDNNEAI